MPIEFHPIRIEDKAFFDEYYKVYPNISGYTSFVTLFCWKETVNYEFAVVEGTPLLKFYNKTDKKERFFLPATDKKEIEKTVSLIEQNHLPLSFQNISSEQAAILQDLFPGRFNYSRNRDGDNYIYLSESLASLSGKKLHSKKNHLNKFKNTYDYSYIRLGEDIFPNASEFQRNGAKENVLMVQKDHMTLQHVRKHLTILQHSD